MYNMKLTFRVGSRLSIGMAGSVSEWIQYTWIIIGSLDLHTSQGVLAPAASRLLTF